jgi:hypothetical protein
MLIKSNDPIPAKTIVLTEAFEKFIKTRFPDLRELEDQAEKSLHSTVSLHSDVKLVEQLDKETGLTEKIWQTSQGPELNRYDSALREAELSFRKWAGGESGPKACVQDPVTREWRQIDRREWTKGSNVPPGIHDDYVSPDDMSARGPSDAQFNGILSKVFFDLKEFATKLQGGSEISGGCRRGAIIKFDWPDAKDFAFRLLNEQGEFREWDSASDWKCKADLERKVLIYMEKSTGEGEGPGESTIRAKVKEWFTEWRTKANKECSPQSGSAAPGE